MKKTLALVTLLLLPASLQAGPIHWLKEHKRVTVALAVLGATSLAQWRASEYCRAPGFDVERCEVGYGSSKTFNAITIGIGVGMFGAGEACRKDQPGWWFCPAMQYAVPAAQTTFALHDVFNRRLEATASGLKRTF